MKKMKNKSILLFVLVISTFLLEGLFSSCNQAVSYQEQDDNKKTLNIGWSSVDITPEGPVLIRGQHYARVSEGVMDSLTATALAMESGSGPDAKRIIMVSCDLTAIPDGTSSSSGNNLLDNVREQLKVTLPELQPEQIILNATHTHSAPICGTEDSKGIYGLEFKTKPPVEYLEYVTKQIVKVASQAWYNREPGGISYGLGQAVVGQNRLVVDLNGKSQMYGAPHTNREEFGNINNPKFSHFEGYEDHSVNLLYTWDKEKKLTGIIINIAAPSQVSMHSNLISADYWHDTREEVRKRLGKDLYILPQCSAAGDQDTYVMANARAEERMQRLMFPDSIKTGNESIGRRKQIAMRIADAVTSVFPYMKGSIDWAPEFSCIYKEVQLPRRLLNEEDVKMALEESEVWGEKYNQLLTELETNTGNIDTSKLYIDITYAYKSMIRGEQVKKRYELEKIQPKIPIEMHVLRIGDVAIATNPFELYLDYGIRIKARSPAIQTFLVQLAGSGSYVPTSRSISGGAYGAVPASTLIGTEGGQELVESTLDIINELWEK